MNNIKAPKTDTEYRISFAQSWNLAVAMMANHIEISGDEHKKHLERWQKYFYQKLVLDFVESEGKDALNKLNSDPLDKAHKHRQDFVEDLAD